jgi:hypothetical protein
MESQYPSHYCHFPNKSSTPLIRVVILGVWRLSGGPNRPNRRTGLTASGPIHYVRYELDILDIFFEYSLKIP